MWKRIIILADQNNQKAKKKHPIIRNLKSKIKKCYAFWYPLFRFEFLEF